MGEVYTCYSVEAVNGVTAMGVRAVAVPILVPTRPGHLMHSDCSKLLSSRQVDDGKTTLLVLVTKMLLQQITP